MDGLGDYVSDPLEWASLVLLEHIDKYNSEQVTEGYLNNTLDSIYDFIEGSFDEEGLTCPPQGQIIERVMRRLVDE